MGATSGQTILAGGQLAASTAVTIASATGSLAPLAATLGVTVPVLGAVIGAGIMAAGLAINAIMNSGCGQTCIVSTQFANQANAALQQNIAAYFALPVPRARSAQLVALENFDRLWAWLQQQCGNPNLADAGRRCITDRQAGACVWHQAASTVPPWGTPAAGECWNWFNGYRNPIADDTNVYDDSVLASPASAASTVTAAGASLAQSVQSLPPWALPALILLALAVAL